MNDRDLLYVGAFAVGAVIGLGAFVTLLKWLLAHRAGITLAILTGLMVGSLRALWPWQTEDRDLLAPDSLLLPALLIGGLGAGIVVVLLFVERRLGISEEQMDAPA